MSNNNYIYSLDGFKSGMKYSFYSYLEATLASLFVESLLSIIDPDLILPFTLLISNPVTWATLEVVFIVLSGIVMNITKPSFYLTKDFINERKIQKRKEETVSNHKTLSKSESQDSGLGIRSTDKSNNTSRKSSSTALDSDVSVREEKDSAHQQRSIGHLGLERYRNLSEFMNETNQGNYKHWLGNCDIYHIAYATYKYLPRQINDDVYFSTLVYKGYTELLALELRGYKEAVKKGPRLMYFNH